MVTDTATQTAGGVASPVVPVPDELAARLRSIRERLDAVDAERDQLIDERDQLVVAARDQGGSLREIAELLGVTHPLVKHIEDKRRTT